MSTLMKKTPPDEVDRAMTAIRRAVGRLVALLGHEDPEIVKKAARELPTFGRPAVDQLALALPRATNHRHRAAIILVLHRLGTQAPEEVGAALTRVVQRDDDPIVRGLAREALTTLVLAQPFGPDHWAW